MTLFFPDSTSNVKINASNSQVNVSVGENMTISAGDTFMIGAGSTSTIQIGPATSFNLGTSVGINLAATTNYTYGRTAGFGLATTQTTQIGMQNASESYTIKAGSDVTKVKQTLNIAQNKQVYLVLAATVVSMGAIALAVVGGLSSPIFVAENPSDSSNDNVITNDSSDVARGACAMAITTVAVFALQWLLTYILTNSSEFKPVSTLDMNKEGITATVQMEGTSGSSVETSLSTTSGNTDGALLIHRVNKVAQGVKADPTQFSEVTLAIDKITLKSTAQDVTGAAPTITNNTEILLDSVNKKILLESDSKAAIKGGDIVIGKDTAITNPDGSITLSGISDTDKVTTGLYLDAAAKSAKLTCSDANSAGGSVVATLTQLDLGVDKGGNATFNADGATIKGSEITLSSTGTIKISGTSINLGDGALTIVGQAGKQDNTVLGNILKSIESATAAKKESDDKFEALQKEIQSLKDEIKKSKQKAGEEVEELNESISG